MKTTALVAISLASMLASWTATAQNNQGPNQAPPTTAPQNAQYQTLALIEQKAQEAQTYAKQAAAYNTPAAREASRNASNALRIAGQARRAISIGYPLGNALATVERNLHAAKQAAEAAKLEEAQSKIEKERDQALQPIKEKYQPQMAELRTKMEGLKATETSIKDQINQIEKEQQVRQGKQAFQPKDPWRELNGKVQNAKESNWLQFTGIVLEARAGGILIHGTYGPPLEAPSEEKTFFVDHFPLAKYGIADNDKITPEMQMVAHISEPAEIFQYTNNTPEIRVNTVKKLDYGKPVTSPKTDPSTTNPTSPTNPNQPDLVDLNQKLLDNQDEQGKIQQQIKDTDQTCDQECAPIIAEFDEKIKNIPQELEKAAKQKEEAKKLAVEESVLKNNQALADAGDLYGLLRMGERYRDGEGVPKNLDKARDYMQKAVKAGNPDAQKELDDLLQNQ